MAMLSGRKGSERWKTWLERLEVCVGGERQNKSNVSGLPGAPPTNTGFLVSVESGFTGPTTWLTSESTSSWTTLASRITEANQERMRQFSQEDLHNSSSSSEGGVFLLLFYTCFSNRTATS